MYSDVIYYIAVSLMYFMAILFFLLMCLGSGRRLHSAVIVAACLVGVAIPESKNDSMAEFLRQVNTAMVLDALTAFTMAAIVVFDRAAIRQMRLLIFESSVHFMVIWNLTEESSLITSTIYTLYDELIISVGLLQMWVSRNGISTALQSLWEYVSDIGFGIWGYSKSCIISKIGEKTP